MQTFHRNSVCVKYYVTDAGLNIHEMIVLQFFYAFPASIATYSLLLLTSINPYCTPQELYPLWLYKPVPVNVSVIVQYIFSYL